MGAACQQSPHSYTMCGHFRTCIQCAAEWGQREDQENRANMTNDLQNFEELTRDYYFSAAQVRPEDHVPTLLTNIHLGDHRETDYWDRRRVYTQLISTMHENRNLQESLALRGVMRVKKQLIHELAANIIWTAGNEGTTGRLAYDWAHFTVRKAVINACSNRETTGYIVFRHVMLPIQQLVYADLLDQEGRYEVPQNWFYSVRDKIQAILGLAYHYYCKKTHTGIASSITPDIMAALAPVMGVANMIENAIAMYVRSEMYGGMLEPCRIAERFRMTTEEVYLWETHMKARAHSEDIMRYRERRRAAPADPWTSVAMQDAGGGMTFSITASRGRTGRTTTATPDSRMSQCHQLASPWTVRTRSSWTNCTFRSTQNSSTTSLARNVRAGS